MALSDAVSRRVLFRCDGNAATGLGHLSRSINLARNLGLESSGTSIAFWGRFDAFAKDMLALYRFQELQVPLPAGNATGVAATLAACAGFDVLVLDSYLLDQDYIDGLKGQRCRLALIDDDQRYDLSGADLVICFRAGAEMLDYGARHQLLGPSFLPVKPELHALREYNLALPVEREIARMLVFLSGGRSNEDLLCKVLRALALPGIEVAYLAPVDLGRAAPAKARHIALTPAIESVYAGADFVICGGGLTKYESAYCGIANACLSLTPLQQEDTQVMAALGLTLDLGLADAVDTARLRDQVVKFIDDPTARAAQRNTFSHILASDGPQRVAKTLLAL